MPPEVLSELRALHLPEAPGAFPPAPGWWLLFLVIILAAVMAYRLFSRRRRAMRPLCEALADLEACNSALHQGELAPLPYLDQVNTLLKRLLIHGYGKGEFAKLSSDSWTRALDQFLRRSSKSDTAIRIDSSLLGEFRYRPHAQRESWADLQDACEQLGLGLKSAIEQLAPPEAAP